MYITFKIDIFPRRLRKIKLIVYQTGIFLKPCMYTITSSPVGAWEVKLENMTDQQTDRRVYREVSLPIRTNVLHIETNLTYVTLEYHC